jgi:hypothetical protein
VGIVYTVPTRIMCPEALSGQTLAAQKRQEPFK